MAYIKFKQVLQFQNLSYILLNLYLVNSGSTVLSSSEVFLQEEKISCFFFFYRVSSKYLKIGFAKEYDD